MFSQLSSEGKKIRDYWRPHGRRNANNHKKIKQAMKRSGMIGSSIPLFLYHEKYQKKHAVIAKLLDL
jgi:hypothetical protein